MGMNRNAAHRNVLSLFAVAFGQSNIQRRRSFDRIVKKHFVKIAHTVKQQIAFVLAFDFEILFHHRR